MSMGPAPGLARRRQEPSADINVTPLVDVMLVLLVIFIITAPTLQKDNIDIRLPQTKAGTGSARPTYQMSVVVDESGNVRCLGKTFSLAEAEKQLPKLLAGHEKNPIVLKAYRGLPYEKVVWVMSILRLSGIKDIVIAVETPGGRAKAPGE